MAQSNSFITLVQRWPGAIWGCSHDQFDVTVIGIPLFNTDAVGRTSSCEGVWHAVMIRSCWNGGNSWTCHLNAIKTTNSISKRRYDLGSRPGGRPAAELIDLFGSNQGQDKGWYLLHTQFKSMPAEFTTEVPNDCCTWKQLLQVSLHTQFMIWTEWLELTMYISIQSLMNVYENWPSSPSRGGFLHGIRIDRVKLTNIGGNSSIDSSFVFIRQEPGFRNVQRQWEVMVML